MYRTFCCPTDKQIEIMKNAGFENDTHTEDKNFVYWTMRYSDCPNKKELTLRLKNDEEPSVQMLIILCMARAHCDGYNDKAREIQQALKEKNG